MKKRADAREMVSGEANGRYSAQTPRLLPPSHCLPLDRWREPIPKHTPSEGDSLGKPHDCSSCKYWITFFTQHLARMSFREKLSHIICMLNSFTDSVKVVFYSPLKSGILISELLRVKTLDLSANANSTAAWLELQRGKQHPHQAGDPICHFSIARKQDASTGRSQHQGISESQGRDLPWGQEELSCQRNMPCSGADRGALKLWGQ